MRRRADLARLSLRWRLFLVGFLNGFQPLHQLVQLRAGLVHGAGELGQVDLDLAQLAVYVAGGGLKGIHKGLILFPEEINGFPQL